MANTPPTTLLASTTNILHEASQMQTAPRFLHLLEHAKLLIQTYGPYTTTHSKSTVFIRGQDGHRKPRELTPELLAYSLAAAQDCSNSPQSPISAEEDLIFFKELWSATIVILEAILDARVLSSETLGWGLLGLCAGYAVPTSDRDFAIHKLRMQNVLKFLASMGNSEKAWRVYQAQMVLHKKKIQVQSTIPAEAHSCATMLVQRFRREEWARIRWYHAVAVAEQWVRHLRLEKVKVEDGGEALKENLNRGHVVCEERET